MRYSQRLDQRGQRLAVIIAALAAVVVLAACGSAPASRQRSSSKPSAPTAKVSASLRKRPNVVFVLTDDLSMDLLRYMPQLRALQRSGRTFRNYFVSDSLCCPSRASIFTGNFPHDTGVFTNAGPHGGIRAFYAHDDEHTAFNVVLQRAGYRTAMMGKYLNGYLQGPHRSPVASTYVPPGWSEWDVAGWGYPEFGYTLNQNGRLHYYGHAPRDYLTSVLAHRGTQFIDSSAHTGRPFFLELSTFSPHAPYTPAPRDAHMFRTLVAPKPPSFDAMPVDPPSWLAGHRPLRPRQIRDINRVFRRRVQDVQSLGRLLTTIRHAVAANGLTRTTYIVFSSDNGLHTGEYRLMPGKLTAFDTDIHVPLVVAGPGVRHGSTTDAMAENTDLARTFEAMGGTSAPSDGHSLMALLHGGGHHPRWRDAVLVEHRGPAFEGDDPDRQTETSGNPTSYEAMRTPQFLYVEYTNGEREFYDLRADPFELHNIVRSLTPTRLAQLHGELSRLEHCHRGSCWAAGHVVLGDAAAVARWGRAVKTETRVHRSPASR